MLQDKYLPEYYVSKTENVEINASVDQVYSLVEELDFSGSKVIYWLFRLRGIPVPEGMSLRGLEKMGFIRLEAIKNSEIILGLVGQFWTPSGKMRQFTPEEFTSLDDPEFAKATWSFQVSHVSNAVTRLSTETRVFCPTPAVRRKFGFYWSLIGPFSSWTRREMLKALKKRVGETESGEK